jgi:DNA repair protein RadA/Sms
MVLAVLERRGRQHLGPQDVYVATVGGVRLTEPASDLAVSLAVARAASDRPLPGDLVAIGEVGLAGEIRPVGGLVARLQEAARLGFRRALVPDGVAVEVDGIRLVPAADLHAALLVLNDSVSTRRPDNVVRLDLVR